MAFGLDRPQITPDPEDRTRVDTQMEKLLLQKSAYEPISRGDKTQWSLNLTNLVHDRDALFKASSLIADYVTEKGHQALILEDTQKDPAAQDKIHAIVGSSDGPIYKLALAVNDRLIERGLLDRDTVDEVIGRVGNVSSATETINSDLDPRNIIILDGRTDAAQNFLINAISMLRRGKTNTKAVCSLISAVPQGNPFDREAARFHFLMTDNKIRSNAMKFTS